MHAEGTRKARGKGGDAPERQRGLWAEMMRVADLRPEAFAISGFKLL